MKRATRNDDDCERALLRTYHVLKAFASIEDIPEETKERVGMYIRDIHKVWMIYAVQSVMHSIEYKICM